MQVWDGQGAWWLRKDQVPDFVRYDEANIIRLWCPVRWRHSSTVSPHTKCKSDSGTEVEEVIQLLGETATCSQTISHTIHAVAKYAACSKTVFFIPTHQMTESESQYEMLQSSSSIWWKTQWLQSSLSHVWYKSFLALGHPHSSCSVSWYVFCYSRCHPCLCCFFPQRTFHNWPQRNYSADYNQWYPSWPLGGWGQAACGSFPVHRQTRRGWDVISTLKKLTYIARIYLLLPMNIWLSMARWWCF